MQISTFLHKVLKTSIAENIFKNVSLLNYDLWSLSNFHSWKQKNLNNSSVNPIQDGRGGGGKKAPLYQFFPCNF